MKFDNIVGNPPYSSGLHVKIFNKSFDLLNEGGHLIYIHPSTPFVRWSSHGKDDITIQRIVEDYSTELKFVDGNNLFEADFLVPLSITNVTKIKDKNIKVIDEFIGNSIINYDGLIDVTVHGNPLSTSIRNRISKKINTNISKYLFRRHYVNNNYVIINRISGHRPKNGKLNPDFYQMIYKDDESDFEKLHTEIPRGKKPSGTSINEIGFNSKTDAQNGFEYFKTKFVRFCLSLRKTAGDIVNLQMEMIPYMDFSRSWSDQELFEYFEFTQDEIDFILDFIPNLYDRDFELYPNKLG